jgi:5,5'-dehydrodivanillate O-demethylase
MDVHENEMLTRVGPGTPAGETLRKYWLPVGFSSEVESDTPILVRWLGEDLILFRDEFGRVGLIYPYCAHRGTSLEYGWIEAGGLRCCYHGWVYDVNGRCIEQPGEPAGSTFKDKIKLKSYPVRELGGLIWAYMGSGEPPELPKYDFLVREDGERGYAGYYRECNYLQQLENALDPVHATMLHGREVGEVRQAPEWQEFPQFEVLSTESMACYVARRKGPAPDTEWHREVAYVPPIMVVHNGGSVPNDSGPAVADVAWRMPIDDQNTRTFTVKFSPFRDGGPWQKKSEERPKAPPLMRGTRKKFDMATINGQDSAAQVGQGSIADRTREHLGYSDRGVIQVRKLWKSSIEAVLRGEDPPNIIRDPRKNGMIHVDVIEKLVKKGELLDHTPKIVCL